MILSERSIQELNSIIKKIDLRSYGEDVVEDLLILLRSVSRRESSIWELASFIAHPEERDRGRFQETMDTIYAKLMHSSLNGIKSQKINPFEIKKSVFNSLIIGGIKLHDKTSFQKELKMTKEGAIKFFNKAYDKKNSPCKLKDIKFLPKIDKIFKLITSIIQTGFEVIKQEELIEEIGSSIQKLAHENNLKFDKNEFIINHEQDITICIMCLLHSRLFKLYDNTTGKCELTVTNVNTNNDWELHLNGSTEVKKDIFLKWILMKFKGDIENYIPNLLELDDINGAYPLKHFNAIRNKNGQLVIGNRDI